MLHTISYNGERDDDDKKIYVETIMIAENRQALQRILNTAINMFTHNILYICMHIYNHLIIYLLHGLCVI